MNLVHFEFKMVATGGMVLFSNFSIFTLFLCDAFGYGRWVQKGCKFDVFREKIALWVVAP